MTKQDKELLFKDLCARLSYGVKVQVKKVGEWDGETKHFVVSKELTFDDVKSFAENGAVLSIKPYLRPMSSMTEKEFSDVKRLFGFEVTTSLGRIYIDDWKQGLNEIYYIIDLIDWLNSHHLDYRGLINKGLAMPATEGMYDF